MNIFATITELINKFLAGLLNLFGEDERVKKVRDLVEVGCGFVPTAASVAAMFGAANPAVTGVVGIAVAICEAVQASKNVQTLVGTAPLGTVNGVPIEGEWKK